MPRHLAIGMVTQFKEIHFPNFCLSTARGDNCFLYNGHVAFLRNILLIEESQNKMLVFEHFSDAVDFFHYPLESSDPKIKRVSALSREYSTVLSSEVHCKCVLLPYKEDFICPPVHTM